MARNASCRLAASSLVLVLVASRAAWSDDLRLVDAARRHDTRLVRTLIQQGVEVNSRQADGATALHWAAHWDDLEMAGAMLDARAEVNVANELGVTPLAIACGNGNARIVARLLGAGARPNEAFAHRPSPLMLCARSGNTAAVQSLLARGANVDAAEPRRGQTALMWAAANGHSDIVKVLLARGADLRVRSRVTPQMVNRADPNDIYTAVIGEVPVGGSTALLFAAARGHVESASLLVAAGAPVDDSLPDGASALVVAAHSGHRALATWLLGKGANPNASGAGYTALHAAVLRGDLELTRALLAHRARVDARLAHGTPTVRAGRGFVLPENLTGATPLLLAAKFLEPAILRMLLAHEADPRATLADGSTALMLAAGILAQGPLFDRRGRLSVLSMSDEQEALDIVTLLLESGDARAANTRGETALHGASARGYRTVVQLLLDRGARPDARNVSGKSAGAVADAKVRDLLPQ